MIILIFLALSICSLLIYDKIKGCELCKKYSGFLIFLIISVAAILTIFRYDTYEKITEFHKTEIALLRARYYHDSFSAIMLKKEVNKKNKWLEQVQIMNKHIIFDICIPDDVDSLKAINLYSRGFNE